ncbi:unnamed protein product [Plutella xylostella]|uniref:(diamondback moth) hypothetical protein n=1 Tax=Plutella xylostella TaxID=51655 RepID=A0A8S4DSV7_PLUXY|nr:unnamed protein product [Plutella xylostella]
MAPAPCNNHPWLELSDVHCETTEGVRVTVIPFYMGSREAQNSAVYWHTVRTPVAGAERRAPRDHGGRARHRHLYMGSREAQNSAVYWVRSIIEYYVV